MSTYLTTHTPAVCPLDFREFFFLFCAELEDCIDILESATDAQLATLKRDDLRFLFFSRDSRARLLAIRTLARITSTAGAR